MAKLILDDVGNFNSTGLGTINANNDKIVAALENTLSRDGTSPNQMTADLDLNNNDIINIDNVNANHVIADDFTLGSGVSFQTLIDQAAASATAAQTAETNAETAEENSEAAATLSQAWAEGTLPGGAGTKSAKEWADTALAAVPNVSPADRTALAAVDTATHTVAYLTEAGREGQFRWAAGNLSAKVSADTQQGIYVAPASDTTGASGAWVRALAFNGPGGGADLWLAAWWGVTPDPNGNGTGPDQAPAINGMVAIANIERPAALLFGNGNFPLDSAITKFAHIAGVYGRSAGRQPTIFYKRYVETDNNRGIFSCGDYGATFKDIQFAAGPGASGGSAISAILETADRTNIGILNLERISSSCGDGINQNLHINGSVNDPVAGGAAGASYRNVRITQCFFFGAKDYCVVLISVQHVFASDNFFVTSGGSMNGQVVYISGSTNAYSDDINFTGGIIAGDVQCRAGYEAGTGRVTFDTPIYGNLTVTADSFGPVQVGYISGSISDASNRSVQRKVYKVEEGSNANGSWIKFSDGRIEQWGTGTSVSGDLSVTWPVPFTSAVHSVDARGTQAPAANFITLAQAHSATTSGCSIRAMSLGTGPNVGLASAALQWHAIGI